MTLIEAAKLALYALEMGLVETFHARQENAITALRTAIETYEKQEPVAWMDEFGNVFPLGAQRGPKYLNEPMKPLYTTPPAAQPAPVQEPVAWVQHSAIEWLSSDKRGPFAYVNTLLSKRKDDLATTPVYTTPPAAQPEQLPIAWPMEEQPDGTVIPVDPSEMPGDVVFRLLATPPQQEPLTEAEIADVWDKQLFDITDMSLAIDFVRDIEAAHGITGEKT
jgi:hypothetical protein